MDSASVTGRGTRGANHSGLTEVHGGTFAHTDLEVG